MLGMLGESAQDFLPAGSCQGWLMAQSLIKAGRHLSKEIKGMDHGIPAPLMVEWGYLSSSCVSTADPQSQEVIDNICKAGSSISCMVFNIHFNLDISPESSGDWPMQRPYEVGQSIVGCALHAS
ncbi:hypothetical protein P7K49_035994 [Saguinus oedipus]|uniref:Uncharacterized protein n=1 Tax=Saguinus oedipus TaxID=9490 RepID=A0ABQ9TP72_SAGOE|nr:hypothetical protein P7K49_035994 [Saguinus oedipus]